MTDKKARKISVSLPDSLVVDMDAISYALGISRSAFISACLMPTIPPMRKVVRQVEIQVIDESTDNYDDLIKRYRSGSKSHIDDLIKRLSGALDGEVQGDLFDGK